MTTAPDMFLETVSLNDDMPSSSSSVSSSAPSGVATVDMERLEAQYKLTQERTPIPESDDDDELDDYDPYNRGEDGDPDVKGDVHKVRDVVVIVDQLGDNKHLNDSSSHNNGFHHVLPPLRVQHAPDMGDGDVGDYVDASLFSPEVSRHALEVAHRRAKSIHLEVQELMALEGDQISSIGGGASGVKLSAGEAVGIITSAFLSSFSRIKQLVRRDSETEYDLLSGSSPQSKIEDLDTDGDGLQISPDASKGDGKHFQTPKIRPALKRISAYSSLRKENSSTQKKKPKKVIHWHEEVLDQDEEFCDDGEDEAETHGLMNVNGGNSGDGNGNSPHMILNYDNGGQLTPRSKKKRKKLVRSMMRRLSPKEKEELYKERPDLMIVPNWAQKYREEISGEESTRWGFWLITIIGTLAVLLIILIILIARDRAHATVKQE